MSYSTRMFALLLAFFLAQCVRADDKPPAKPTTQEDARRAALVKAGYTPVPLSLGSEDLWFFVEGTVGSEKVRFLLDSGIGWTVLDLAVAKRLKVELDKGATLVGPSGSGAAYRVTFPGLTLGSYDALKHWNRFKGLASDLSGGTNGPTGLLGMGALHGWAAVIDYPFRTLYIRPWLQTVWPRLDGTWTVTSWQEEGQTRKLDPKAPPTFTFADRRLKLTDGDKTREYAIRLSPANYDGVDIVRLSDPKQDSVLLADGLLKVVGGRMTACLALDVKKSKKSPAEFAAPKGSGYVLLELTRTAPIATDLKPHDWFRQLLVKDGYTAVPLKQGADGKRMVTARAGGHTLRLLVDTGANATAFDTAGLDKWGAKRLGEVETQGLSGIVKAEEIRLRGLRVGAYDTRGAWAVVSGRGFDLSGVNKARAQLVQSPLQGYLGNLDLLTGSAVIDFGTNTLYLRPVKKTLWPQLEGKWIGVAWESDGKKGRYNPGDGSVEFKDGRVRFTTPGGGTKEWGFHLRDEGDRYRLGLFDPKADELADGFAYSGAGLLRLAGDTLTVVMRRDGAPRGVPTPTEFAAPKGSGLLLVEFKRAK